MLRNPKTRAKKTAVDSYELCPPTSPACIKGLDLASAVTSYTPRTLTAHDIPDIPVYNREKNRIQRFSRVASVPVPCTVQTPAVPDQISEKRVMSYHPLSHPPVQSKPVAQLSQPPQRRSVTAPSTDHLFHMQQIMPQSSPAEKVSPEHPSIPSFMPLGTPALNASKHETFPDYSDASSVTFSDHSTKSPAAKRNSTFDSPGHRRGPSANTLETGPSGISQVDLFDELDNSSFYEYYFNQSYFQDTDSLFSSDHEGPAVPPKQSLAILPKQGPAVPKQSLAVISPTVPSKTRRVFSDVQQTMHTRATARRAPVSNVCLDLCADYEKSRFMIPESYRVRPQRRVMTAMPAVSNEKASKHKSLPSVPSHGVYQRISSEAKQRISRIFSK